MHAPDTLGAGGIALCGVISNLGLQSIRLGEHVHANQAERHSADLLNYTCMQCEKFSGHDVPAGWEPRGWYA